MSKENGKMEKERRVDGLVTKRIFEGMEYELDDAVCKHV